MLEPLLGGGGGKGDKEAGEAHPLASPFALGSLALLVQSFVIGAIDGIYGVPLTYYMYDVLDISGDNSASLFSSSPLSSSVSQIVTPPRLR